MNRFMRSMLAVLFMLVVAVGAGAETYGDFIYSVYTGYDHDYITIDRYNGIGGAVEVPAEINGVPVEEIGRQAFYWLYDWENWKGLTSVKLPDSIRLIGESAFQGREFTSIELPKSLEGIGERAFRGSSLSGTLVIPDGVYEIGESAFYGCNLTNVKLSTGLESIGSYAFAETALNGTLVIPEEVHTIEEGAFGGCKELISIEVNEGNDRFYSEDGILYYYDKWGEKEKQLVCCPAGKKGSVTIPEGVTTILSNAFQGCGNLTSISIPSSVEEIQSFAFYECGNLTGIVIPNSVAEIQKYTFYHCTGLTDIIIPDSIQIIDSYAFSGCSGLKSIVLPDSIEILANHVFINCTGLTDIVFPAEMNSISISYGMFRGCSGLTRMIIPDGVTSIDSEAFYDCSNLAEVTLPDGLLGIFQKAFYGCPKLTSITIPASVTYIDDSNPFDSTLQVIRCYEGSYAHSWAVEHHIEVELIVFDYSQLGSTIFRVPANTKVIASGAFANTAAEVYVLPAGVETVEADAFANLTNAKAIIVPAGVNLPAEALTGTSAKLYRPDGTEVEEQ